MKLDIFPGELNKRSSYLKPNLSGHDQCLDSSKSCLRDGWSLSQGSPEMIPFTNPHTQKRHINRVVFVMEGEGGCNGWPNEDNCIQYKDDLMTIFDVLLPDRLSTHAKPPCNVACFPKADLNVHYYKLLKTDVHKVVYCPGTFGALLISPIPNYLSLIHISEPTRPY